MVTHGVCRHSRSQIEESKFMKKQYVTAVFMGVVGLLTVSIAQAYFWGGNIKNRKDVVENPAVSTFNPGGPVTNPGNGFTYTFVPVEKLTDMYGANFNIRDFKDFAARNFGVTVEKDVPSDAVIMYQLKIINDRLDNMQKD